VQISLSILRDIELLLGKESISTVQTTQVLCDELFPIILSYTTSHQCLEIELDYETRVEKVDRNNQVYLGHFKPAENLRKIEKNQKKLDKRKRKKIHEEEGLVDHSNILETWIDNSFDESPPPTNVRSKRIKRDSM
jgi:hypothetical protein